MTPLDIVKVTVKALDGKKAYDICAIDVEEVSTLADYFVIATGSSSTQIKALADEVEFRLKQEGINVNHIEGHRSNSWVLLDYGSVIVHVFSEEARDFYDLDRLWKDGKDIDISDILID
ncbi:MAG: ribosome silencing factor [Clostridia bacterium]|nr:ribosome silencing factor [Clostridia bacterium]